MPRTPRFGAGALPRAYARREAAIDRVILACFVLGLPGCQLGEGLRPLLGQRVSDIDLVRLRDYRKAQNDATAMRGRHNQASGAETIRGAQSSEGARSMGLGERE
jgi:hypothetical protein